MTRALLIVLGVVGCATSEPIASRTEHLGSLVFDVPADWARADYGNYGMQTSVWTPLQNERKESISVLRVERAAQKVKGAALEQLVEAAQGVLHDAHVVKTERFTTDRGVSGARTTLSFVPRGTATAYQRVHATFVDGDALVHVVYTAVDPDPTAEPFTLVLESVRHEEGR